MFYSPWVPTIYLSARFYSMGWRVIVFWLFFLLTVVESSKQQGKMWSVSLGDELKLLHRWPIWSAGVFVVLAFVLSMFLIFEHLAVYNQPEERKFLIGLILMVPVYALESRLALYRGVCPIKMEFFVDAEETFEKALPFLQKQGMVKEGEEEALVQSGRQPISQFQSTHNIQVRKV